MIAMSNDQLRVQYNTTFVSRVSSAFHCVLYKIQEYVWIRGGLILVMTFVVTVFTH
jgi:hypothetical protein